VRASRALRTFRQEAALGTWASQHAVRALSGRGPTVPVEGTAPRRRRRKYDAIRDALTALWEASDRVRLVAMIPILLLSLERHGRLQLGKSERSKESAPLVPERFAMYSSAQLAIDVFGAKFL
jgi:hypothetical protein